MRATGALHSVVSLVARAALVFGSVAPDFDEVPLQSRLLCIFPAAVSSFTLTAHFILASSRSL